MTNRMNIGIFGSNNDSTVNGVLAEAKAAERDGFASYWQSQIFGLDALSTLSVVGHVVPRIEPDAVAYSSQFYASHHIPSYNRPGNNTINSNDYKTYNLPGGDNNYNFSCYVNNVLG